MEAVVLALKVQGSRLLSFWEMEKFCNWYLSMSFWVKMAFELLISLEQISKVKVKGVVTLTDLVSEAIFIK